MDVTALLNENAAAVDQQKEAGGEALRLPTRSRTPWDAGGYSLPLNMAATIKSPPSSQNRDSEQPEDDDSLRTAVPFTLRPQSAAPTSPFHQFTDSRSSLSSFTSSAFHSTTHSRYSSISTLNSPRNLSISLSEQLLLSPKASTEAGDVSYFRFREKSELQGQFPREHSPNRSLDTLAQIAEHHSMEEISPKQTRSIGGIVSQQSVETKQRQWRPSHIRSASSGGTGHQTPPAVDIWTSIEAEQKILKKDTTNRVEALGERQVNDIKRPSSPSDTLLIKRTTLPTLHLNTHERRLAVPFHSIQNQAGRSHKRALSAPNFAAMDMQAHRSPMAHEITPPTSNHPDHGSPQSAFQHSPPATPPATDTPIAHAEPTCMYIDDCDTDSPQRKAISHIFGRNKMCTRMIPEHLWVHLCRKHYQRCRYRDQNKWAKVQCDLVQLQIRRIHDWSLENQLTSNGIRLVGWSLTMRKREKVRREKAALAKRKRDEDGDGDDNGPLDGGDSEYTSVQTQVPDWLVKHCDQDFDTQGILAIFNRLHQEVLDGRVGPQFPDIELLPNLVSPDDLPKTKKVVTNAPKKSHQRSQSMITTSSHESSFRDHTQKRQRREELMPERVLHSLPVRQMSRRPTYPSIHEDVETGFQQQMAAPQPQPRRFDGPSMTAQLEAGGFHPNGRPSHQRSQSDAFFQGRSAYTRSPPSHRSTPHYQQISSAHNGEYSVIDEESQYGAYSRDYSGHGRFQSTDRHHYQMSLEQEMARNKHYASPLERSFGHEMDQRPRHFGHNRHNSSPAQRSQYPLPPQQRSTFSPFTGHPEQGLRMRD